VDLFAATVAEDIVQEDTALEDTALEDTALADIVLEDIALGGMAYQADEAWAAVAVEATVVLRLAFAAQ
jgi:hypothetical protein